MSLTLITASAGDALSGVFAYIISLGASVMMPIIFTILGVRIGIKFSKALKSGLLHLVIVDSSVIAKTV